MVSLEKYYTHKFDKISSILDSQFLVPDYNQDCSYHDINTHYMYIVYFWIP